jgi:hypothetical protein
MISKETWYAANRNIVSLTTLQASFAERAVAGETETVRRDSWRGLAIATKALVDCCYGPELGKREPTLYVDSINLALSAKNNAADTGIIMPEEHAPYVGKYVTDAVGLMVPSNIDFGDNVRVDIVIDPEVKVQAILAADAAGEIDNEVLMSYGSLLRGVQTDQVQYIPASLALDPDHLR